MVNGRMHLTTAAGMIGRDYRLMNWISPVHFVFPFPDLVCEAALSLTKDF